MDLIGFYQCSIGPVWWTVTIHFARRIGRTLSKDTLGSKSPRLKELSCKWIVSRDSLTSSSPSLREDGRPLWHRASLASGESSGYGRIMEGKLWAVSIREDRCQGLGFLSRFLPLVKRRL